MSLLKITSLNLHMLWKVSLLIFEINLKTIDRIVSEMFDVKIWVF